MIFLVFFVMVDVFNVDCIVFLFDYVWVINVG